jgi:hypothetical protein
MLVIERLLSLTRNPDINIFRQQYKSSIQERMVKEKVEREPMWTKSILLRWDLEFLSKKSRGK